MNPWANLKDRVKTNHPSATVVALDDERNDPMISLSLGVLYIGATLRTSGCVDLKTEKMAGPIVNAFEVRLSSKSEAESFVMDALNASWHLAQRSKTSPGGPSSSSGGGDEGEDAVSDHYYEPADEGDDE